jgi:hypothetical protein
MAHYSPTYYTRGSIECWDAIRDWELNYHLGCAIKYICRAGHKSTATKTSDIKKAIHYLENELLHTHQSDGTSGTIPIRLYADDWGSPEGTTESTD